MERGAVAMERGNGGVMELFDQRIESHYPADSP